MQQAAELLRGDSGKMERLLPEYNENIIVGVLCDGIFSWYVTDKEIWYLDYKKRIDAFKRKGFEVKVEYMDKTRKEILILCSSNAKIFLKRIEKLKIESFQLRELLQKARDLSDDSWIYDFRPSLYVDFDSCKLLSLFAEPASYEEYVPMNWQGCYFDFMKLIPDNEKYWLDENNKNLLKREGV